MHTEGRRLFAFYLEVMLKPSLQFVPNGHTDRELRTVVAGLDALMEGDTARTGDILIGRFKALEESLIDGGWELASQMEVVPQNEVGLASEEERHRAATLHLRRQRLETSLGSLRGSRG